jgi:hypothetical protein
MSCSSSSWVFLILIASEIRMMSYAHRPSSFFKSQARKHGHCLSLFFVLHTLKPRQ